MDEVEAIERRTLEEASPKMFRRIALAAGVQLVAAIAIIGASRLPSWRFWGTLLCGGGTLALAFVELRLPLPRWRWARYHIVPVVSVLLFGGMMACVEGPNSPLSALLFYPVIGRSARRGFDRSTRVMVATALATVVALAAMPTAWFTPGLPAETRAWLWVAVFGGVLVVQALQASTLSDAFRAAGSQLDQMREAILRDHAARSRGLETIGAKVAHELKNPLTSIKALLAMMREDVSDDDERERFEVLEGEVDRMQTILQDYLSFSRPLDELRTAPVDLAALGRHTKAVLSARATEASIDLVLHAQPVTVEGDEERLRGVLLNLLGNALEATPRGGTVGLEIRPHDDGAQLLVRDTGRGMDAAALAKLGQPFFSTKAKGTGLGVVIATATIRQHGGTITFDSTPDQGTTATVTLPARAKAGGDPNKSYEKLSHLEVQELLARG